MKKLIKNWFVCVAKLGLVLILCVIVLVIIPLVILNILNIRSSVVLVFVCLVIFLIFAFFGLIFIEKIIKNLDKVNDIVRIMFEDVLNKKECKDFNSDDDEINNIFNRISEVAFKIKSSQHSKNDFISSISHELRTPLTAIKGWAETMKTGDVIDFSTLKRGLEVIIKETERLSSIVEELIDFSEFESGRIKMNMEKIDLIAEISEAVFIFKERAAIESKTLIYNSEPGAVSKIFGDKNRLKQVFVNIIDNAVKYTQENGTINVEVKEKDGKIIVEVSDNGCGIPRHEIPKVKQKFYKANYSHKGSGIGLAISNEIVIYHGGKLEIFSEEGKGTRVYILIPVYVGGD